ncbi:MAG: GNAT family N-acetyltransferase [archaeon]
MKIRKATIEDLKEIKKLNQELFHHDFKFDKTLDIGWPSKNEDYYKKSITGKDSITLIAEDEGEIMGYLIGAITTAADYRKIKQIAKLENMLILKEHRRKGVGKQLIKEFIDWAKVKDAHKAKVIASAQNEPAINAYKSMGFEEYSKTLEVDI